MKFTPACLLLAVLSQTRGSPPRSPFSGCPGVSLAHGGRGCCWNLDVSLELLDISLLQGTRVLSFKRVKLNHLLPRWLNGKESACQCRRCGFDPWVGKSLWRKKWQPTLVFLPGKSHGQRSLEGYSPWGHNELGTTGRLNNNKIV